MHPRPDPQIELGRVAIQILDLLARDMDEIFQDALHLSGTDRHSPLRRRAAVTNRIVVLCRRLVDQIQRYERLRACEIEGETNTRRPILTSERPTTPQERARSPNPTLPCLQRMASIPHSTP